MVPNTLTIMLKLYNNVQCIITLYILLVCNAKLDSSGVPVKLYNIDCFSQSHLW